MKTRDSRIRFTAAALRNLGIAMLIVLTVFVISGSIAGAAVAPDLRTAASFAVLGGSAVTNTGSTVVSGDLGVSPGTAVTGFPPGEVSNGTIHAADAVASQAQSDSASAYNTAAGEPCDEILTGQDLGGLTLTAGTYCYSTSAQLTGTVTFDAQGIPSSVFVIQIGSTLTTASSSIVNLINGADACNIFWQVGSSATLGTNTAFRGSILALTSITLNNSATVVDGRALAQNGAVTMDTNSISTGSCAPTPTRTASPTPTAAPTDSPAPIGSPTPTAAPTDSPAPTGSPTPTAAPTDSPAPTGSPTPTAAPTDSPAPTSTPFRLPIPTPAQTSTPTPLPTMRPSSTPSPTHVVIPILTAAPTLTPAATATAAATPTPAPTVSVGARAVTPVPTAAAAVPSGGPELPRTGAYIALYVVVALALTTGGELMRRWARAASKSA